MTKTKTDHTLWSLWLLAACFLLGGCATKSTTTFETAYMGLDIDRRGYITGMRDLTKDNRNFSPADQPSPLMALYDEDLRRYYYPQNARYDKRRHCYTLTYANGSEAVVHIEATAVGYGATYSMKLGQKDVESCPQKYAIFRVIRTWEEARRANAFPTSIRRLLQNPQLSWRLERHPDGDGWLLYQMEHGTKGQTYHLVPRP